jgi:putative protease
MPLQAARNQPLDTERLWAQLGRLGGSGFVLAGLENHLEGAIVLPVAELNRLRREAVAALEKIPAVISKRPPGTPALARLLPPRPAPVSAAPECAVLCRTLEQLDALLDAGARTLYVDFEDIRRYKEAVARARQTPGAAIYLATPRIQKSGEQGFFKLIENAAPDGVLIRNLGALHHFKDSPLRRIGDFSLNVANPLTAQLLMAPEWGLERITASYDLNAVQLGDLLAAVPPAWLEIVLHQHMPLFHMEHCVFAAFLSEGKDHTTCGRPCDRHQIAVRDRVGATHPVLADVGCRNTVYHGRAQSGAAFLEEFRQAGAHHFRLELLREDAAATRRIYETYCNLLTGALTPATLRAQLQVADQLGVTSGTLTVLGK